VSALSRLKELIGRGSGDTIRVHVLLKGRTASGWYDADQHIKLPVGATLSSLFDEADRRGLPLRTAIAESPHLRHTLMLNGQRCAVDDNLDRQLNDGDDIYLLAPLAGG
jgi:hypothetical protein